jgi:uncharacterized protein
MNKSLKITFLLLLFLLVAFCLISIYHAYRFTHPSTSHIFKPKSVDLSFSERVLITFLGYSPQKQSNAINPLIYNLSIENVEFRSTDNLNLSGWFIKAKKSKGTIILAHGWDGGKEGMLDYAFFLQKNGYNILLFDFRAAGESEGDTITLGYYEKNDILGAINYLNLRKDIDTHKIGAMGFSMGAAALVMAAKDTNSLKAIILDSCYPTLYENVAKRFKKVYNFPKFPFATSLTFFGGLINGFNGFDLAPVKYIGKIDVPIYIIEGMQDYQVSTDDAWQLFEKANEPKYIWLVPGAGHIGGYEKSPKEYEERVVSFLGKYLSPDNRNI